MICVESMFLGNKNIIEPFNKIPPVLINVFLVNVSCYPIIFDFLQEKIALKLFLVNSLKKIATIWKEIICYKLGFMG